jgi:hypothetical protein
MNKKYLLLLLSVQSVLIFLLLIALIFQEPRKQPQGIQTLLSDRTCRATVDSLNRVINELRTFVPSRPFLDEMQLNELKNMGLENPLEDLRNNLLLRSDLIRQQSENGGRMGFYFPDAIHILNSRWAMAYFEDGHYAGALLLNFSVHDDAVTWTVLDEMMY